MPKESLSVYLTAVDGMSPVLASITDKTKALDKESQELQQTYEALQKANKGLIDRKTELQKKLKEVNEEVKEARKNFDALGDEANSDAYSKALEKQQKLRNEISATSKALSENQKIYKENIETIRKGGMESNTSLSDIMAGLNIGEELSSLALTASGTFVTSALGNDMGNIVSSSLSSAVTGATLGHFILPGLGTAIGAAVGGVVGAVEGGIQQLANQDSAFKDYYGGLYSDVKGRSGEMVSSGSTLASGRQTDRISFKTLFGAETTANAYLENLVDMANHTPFLYDDLTAMSKTLATYGYSAHEGDEDYILDTLQTIGDTGAALGMNTSDMTAVAQALGRMKSSGKTTLEYLNILNDRGIGAVGYLADYYGKSQGDIYGMISKGQISGRDAVDIITAALEDAYMGSMEEQSQTFAGISSTLEGLEQELQNAGGGAYNSLRQSGKRAMVDAYGGELGEAIKEINAVMGENQARKENLQDQYMREVLDMVLNGKQGALWSTFDDSQQNTLTELSESFAQWSQIYEDSGRTDEEAGAQMEALYEEAQSLGKAYFDNSGLMEILNDVENEEVDAIREATAGLSEATQAAYTLSQSLSKGVVVTWSPPGEPDGDGTPLSGTESGGGGIADYGDSGVAPYVDAGGVHYHAFGLDRVPYDDYPALLHEGERVLTAAEARAQDAGTGAPLSLTITGNSFVGAPEEMADQLWEIIVRRLEQEAVAAAPK